MTKSASIILRASIQYVLLILALLWLGYFMQEDSSKPDLKSSTELPLRLTITGNAANDYPDLKFGSDISWERYYKNSKEYSSCPLFIGEGTINKYTIDFKFFLTPEGQLIGRYHNHNGIRLDFNGYIEKETGNLKVHLGHDHERSQWDMSPSIAESTETEFVYDGKWGKKGKPSKVTIRLYEKENI